jgi:quinoprotein glucose dehydrogenase
VPGEKTSPTQPFPTKPPPYDHQGVTVDNLIDFTPELRAEAVKIAARYKTGPIFTPPPVSKAEGPIAGFRSSGGTNWPGGSFDPETHIAYSSVVHVVSGSRPAAAAEQGVLGSPVCIRKRP